MNEEKPGTCDDYSRAYSAGPDIPIYLEFMEWSKRFGSDIVGYKVRPGLQKVVILNSYSAIHDALMGRDSADALIGRQKNQMSHMMNPNQLGMRAGPSQFTAFTQH